MSTPQRPQGANVRIGVLGCMAERLKTKLLEADKLVDVVCGPDAVRAHGTHGAEPPLQRH